MKQPKNDGVYFPDPGTVQSAKCGICGTEMEVTRNVNGPTQFVMAVSGAKRLHDAFFCPHYKDDWHKRVSDLWGEIGIGTKSAKIKKLIREEIGEILKKRKVPEEM